MLQALRPHHDGSHLHVSASTIVLGDVVHVRVRVPEGSAVAAVKVRSNPDREPRFDTAAVIATVDGWDWWQVPVEVANPVHRYRFVLIGDDGRQQWLNATGVHQTEPADAEDFRLVVGSPAPGWATRGVMYEVFPDRFARSRAAMERELPAWAIGASWNDPVDPEQPGRSQQLYGGDLDGVAERLDHLSRLGVTILYLTPFFPARSNHRYDALSFDQVDPLLGGDEALIGLVRRAHRRGIRVIGDLTTNHSGDAHEWFRAARHHPEAPEGDFYVWTDDRNDGYESWLGVPSLPKFDWRSAELRRRFIEGPDSVVAKWLASPFELDGWRIDVANMTARHGDQDANAEVRRIIRATMDEVNPDTLLLAESTNDAAPDFQGDAWQGAMTYAGFTRPLWGWLSQPGRVAPGGIGFVDGRVPALTGVQFHAAHTRLTAQFPWRVRRATLNALDTHDTPRFADGALPGSIPVALGLSVALPGLPMVFAGDELAHSGADGELSRTPIDWADASPITAAVSGRPGEHDGAAAERLALYTGIIRLRREQPALSSGGMRWLHVDDDVLVFVREDSGSSVLVCAARAAFDLTLPATAVAGRPERLYGAGEAERDQDRALRLRAPGPSFTAWALPGIVLPA